ncbi:M15 family metallopeptidase [Neobacillus dielmonensis]|uniref:M15 family metallopeptidase n=1 Tax=Neobacillus dielmonensis TaxID=1347369 RepID=UPI0005A7D924|nr:M15 family metallopeptidase [Neobacillus dielmonensis]
MKLKKKVRRSIKTFSILSITLIILVLIIHWKDQEPLPETQAKESVTMPTGLNPIVKERSEQLIQQAAKKGIVVVITDGFRSADDQDKLYKQGRTTEGSIVTHAKGGESYHNYGLAIDFALETPSGEVVWDMDYDRNQNAKSDWTEVVQIAKKLGFDWGGDWAKFKDYPHLEMNFGLTIADLQTGERPPSSTVTADTNK